MLRLVILTLASLLGLVASHLGPYTTPDPVFEDSVYPHPRILLLGGTGTGKSTLGNVLLGRSHNAYVHKFRDSRCFRAEKGSDAVTRETCADAGSWLGVGPNTTIIDTPGFGDKNLEKERNKTEQLFNVLMHEIKYVDAIVLMFNGQAPRFPWSMWNMLKQATNKFGNSIWEKVIIEVTFWSYSNSAMRNREINQETEQSIVAKINQMLSGTFKHLSIDLDAVFIHPIFKPENQNETTQFKKNTAKLFEFAKSSTPLPLKPISVLLAENEMYKHELEQMKNQLGSLEKSILVLRAEKAYLEIVVRDNLKNLDVLRVEKAYLETVVRGIMFHSAAVEHDSCQCEDCNNSQDLQETSQAMDQI